MSPLRNPLRKHLYTAQIKHFYIPVEERQLQRKIKEFIKGGGRYVIAYVRKVFLEKNRGARTQYRDDYIYKPLFNFFNHIVYIDKAYVNPTSQARSRITRELGTRDNPKNIEERPPLTSIRFYIVA
jgi:hypothetical protein